MKKIALIVVLFAGIKIQAQSMLNAYQKQVCSWNDKTQKYDQCSVKEESSVFVISKTEKTVKHTTGKLTEQYTISNESFVADKNTWTYDLISIDGTAHTLVLDMVSGEVNMRNAMAGNKMPVATYRIKK